jgi:hypothetical protein
LWVRLRLLLTPTARPEAPGDGPTIATMPPKRGPLDRLRAICTAFPEVTERLSHGAPTWFVRDKRSFASVWEHGHHDITVAHLCCAAPPGAQEELLLAGPDRFFRPPYVGHRGWLGVRLDGTVDWTEIAELCTDA